ncbi:MAG: hypothetical protein ACKVLA_10755 [Rhodobacterales bacterium]
MARKQRPKISGADENYQSSIVSSRDLKVLPTTRLPVAEEPKKDEPEPLPIAAEAKPVHAARKPAEKPASKRKTTGTRTSAKKMPKESDAAETRSVNLFVTPRLDHAPKLDALEAKGLPRRDMIALAGRRATQSFVPEPKYVAPAEVDRMPARGGHKNSKMVDGDLLDKLREKHDPLRIHSDFAMIRGQYELLFWSCLDDVIEELNEKYGVKAKQGPSGA